MSRQYLAAGIGYPGQYTRIWSGFDLRPFLEALNEPVLRARYGLAPGHVVIGKIARLFELKGHDDLLAVAPELVRRCPAVRFLCVGDGPWRGRFEVRVRAAGLEEHVVFTGLVPPTEVPALTGIMDILVHLSRREGLARALPQAMAAGKPIVAYDCDGAGEVCLDGVTGFLIPPGDQRSLVERLVTLAHDAALRSRLGTQGREVSQKCFPVEKMVGDLCDLYLRLAATDALRRDLRAAK
jgi:glycosyltransferase involved in cell wall biosynthesis